MQVDKYIEQENRIENQEIDPCKFCLLIFDRDINTIQYRKNNLFNKNTGKFAHF